MKQLLSPSFDEILASQLDITAPKHVEISLSEDRSVLWVNVDGICALRICRIPELTVDLK